MIVTVGAAGAVVTPTVALSLPGAEALPAASVTVALTFSVAPSIGRGALSV